MGNSVQCVPKKQGMNVIKTEKTELIPSTTVTRLRILMDYQKLNDGNKGCLTKTESSDISSPRLLLEIKDRNAFEYLMAYHLSMLEDFSYVTEDEQIQEQFLDEQLLVLDITQASWYADIMNFILSGEYPPAVTIELTQKSNL